MHCQSEQELCPPAQNVNKGQKYHGFTCLPIPLKEAQIAGFQSLSMTWQSLAIILEDYISDCVSALRRTWVLLSNFISEAYPILKRQYFITQEESRSSGTQPDTKNWVWDIYSRG